MYNEQLKKKTCQLEETVNTMTKEGLALLKERLQEVRQELTSFLYLTKLEVMEKDCKEYLHVDWKW